MVTSFIPVLSGLTKTRTKFAEWLTPDGVRQFAELSIMGQIGYIIAFLNIHNLHVNAYIDRYDVFLIDPTKLTEYQIQGMQQLDLITQVDDTLYLTYGYIERKEPTSIANNLINGLIEALNCIEIYDFD